jgi:hypothetical protein
MPITRRSALYRIFVVAGGVMLLPACKHEGDSKEETLEALADTLIPSSQTPGAKAVGAHLFALRMIHDCYPQNQQQQYMRGLEAFDQQARQQYGKPFAGCDPKDQQALVSAINAGQNSQKTDDLSFFFRENKNLVIRGYLGSQYFLTKIEVYELVPGRWHGCTPVITKS